MAHTTDIHLNNPTQLAGLLEFGRDYCSDHLGRFFQNKYSLFATVANKFQIPAKFTKSQKKNSLAICVMMNNHIIDIKHFSDIFTEWDKEIGGEKFSSSKNTDKINMLMSDERMLSVIKSFKKVNDEIVIGYCHGNEFTPIN